MATYYKNGDGFILNNFYRDGEAVDLAEKQVKYMLPPHGGELRTTRDLPKAKAAGPAKKKTDQQE